MQDSNLGPLNFGQTQFDSQAGFLPEEIKVEANYVHNMVSYGTKFSKSKIFSGSHIKSSLSVIADACSNLCIFSCIVAL